MNPRSAYPRSAHPRRGPWLMTAWLMLGLLFSVSAPARSLEGQNFDETARLSASGPVLHLNGLGLRGVAWIKAFVAGLYVVTTAHDAQQLLADTGPKRLRLKIMNSVPAEDFAKSLRDGVKKRETPESLAKLQGRMQQLDSGILAAGDLKEGDVVDLDFDPKQGVTFSLNGKPQVRHLPGADLHRAILNIFIGDRPIDKRLKRGLLGT